jgi:hypothetical protein
LRWSKKEGEGDLVVKELIFFLKCKVIIHDGLSNQDVEENDICTVS